MPHNAYTLDNEQEVFADVFRALSTDPSYAEAIAQHANGSQENP